MRRLDLKKRAVYTIVISDTPMRLTKTIKTWSGFSVRAR